MKSSNSIGSESSAILLLILLMVPAGLWGQPQPDPWQRVVDLRASLIRSGPQEWGFAQTFLPAGFSEGETERGQLALDLPLCARWDYDEPYPKSFLLCGRELYSWNPGEPVGHIFAVDSSQPGIDLIRLDAEQLAERYRAEPVGLDALRLTPLLDDERLLAQAELTFSTEPFYLSRLSYHDAEGNLTTFDFEPPKPLEDRQRFEPPARISWEIEGDGR